MARLVLLALCAFVYITSAQDAEDVQEMPLTFFKQYGFGDRLNDSRTYINKFILDLQRKGPSRVVTSVGTSDKRVTLIGSESIASIERSALSVVAHAGCDPYEQVIPIPNDKPNVLMYPSCVVMKQCGGCCGHSSLACKPTSKVSHTVKVTKYVYYGNTVHPQEQVDSAIVEEHTSCECQCKLTEEDCNPALHYFDDWDCKCMCKNERQTCPPNRRWDDELCACRCASIQNCGTGFIFNMATCGCEEEVERSRPSNVLPGTPGEVESRPDASISETATIRDPCHGLVCSNKFYKPTPQPGGTCKCKFDRAAVMAQINQG